MAKRSKTWLSPKKQAELEAKQRKKKRIKTACIFALSVVAAVCVALIIWAIVMSARPYYAEIEIEGYGTVTVWLRDDCAPDTVEYFVELAESGYYDGTLIYRVLKDSMIMGGYGKPDAEPIKGEFSKNGYDNTLSHVRGTISMSRKVANKDKNEVAADFYNTATGKFFIMQRDGIDEYDGYYAAFGTVIDGMDIIDRICEQIATDEGGNLTEGEEPVIKSVTIKRSYNK